MKVPVRIFVALSVLALAVFSIPMLAQNQTYPFPGYPPEFAPSRTSRPVPTPFPRSASKFHKVDRAVPNQYIVVLNDDAVPQGSTGAERRASVTEIAKRMLPRSAEIQSVYGSALRGFCVKLPNEAAAILAAGGGEESKRATPDFVERIVFGRVGDTHDQAVIVLHCWPRDGAIWTAQRAEVVRFTIDP